MKASEKQSTFDIAAQTSGSIEAAFLLALKNGISITDELVPGQELMLTDVVNKDIREYYSNKGIVPVTGISNTDITNTIASEGVEFWAIEMDFIVS